MYFTFKSLLVEDNRVIFRSLCETEKLASVREREKAQEREEINRGGEKETTKQTNQTLHNGQKQRQIVVKSVPAVRRGMER